MVSSIKKIGEFGLIDRVKKMIKTDPSVIKGTGDDCAVIKFSRDKYMLLTCDMIVEGVDFTAKDDPYLVGRKAIAISVSDIASCAGLPRYCLVSLGIPPRSTLRFTDKLIKGMLSVTGKYGINLVGGDISRSKKVVIDVSMAGLVNKKKLVLRSGAKEGDVIFVTGKLGGSISGKHLTFAPRLKEAQALTKAFKVNSMIDISDGLTQDLGHILKESSKGAVIYEEFIPLSSEARNLNDALYMGEDFELLFTMSKGESRKLRRSKLKFCRPIGQIVHQECGLRLVDKKGRVKELKPKGFLHF